MTIKIKSGQFRNLENSQILIKDIYPEYRFGWVESERTFHTFIYFPNSCTRDVVYSGDEDTKPKEGETEFHLRKQEYDKELGKFKFTKIAPPNLDFFKLYKKVYDVDVVLSNPVDVTIWDKEQKKEVFTTIQPGETVRLVAFPASRIQGIAQSMMLSKGIEKQEVTVKDRLTGEMKKEKRLPFNWEDKVIPQMIGKAFEFAVNGSGLDTKYAFKEVAPFTPKNESALDIMDTPF